MVQAASVCVPAVSTTVAAHVPVMEPPAVARVKRTSANVKKTVVLQIDRIVDSKLILSFIPIISTY